MLRRGTRVPLTFARFVASYIDVDFKRFFATDITKVGLIWRVNGSGRKGRVGAGGVKENHRAVQSLIHQLAFQAEGIWIRKIPAAKKSEPYPIFLP
jgi:hypothetical protein